MSWCLLLPVLFHTCPSIHPFCLSSLFFFFLFLFLSPLLPFTQKASQARQQVSFLYVKHSCITRNSMDREVVTSLATGSFSSFGLWKEGARRSCISEYVCVCVCVASKVTEWKKGAKKRKRETLWNRCELKTHKDNKVTIFTCNFFVHLSLTWSHHFVFCRFSTQIAHLSVERSFILLALLLLFASLLPDYCDLSLFLSLSLFTYCLLPASLVPSVQANQKARNLKKSPCCFWCCMKHHLFFFFLLFHL